MNGRPLSYHYIKIRKFVLINDRNFRLEKSNVTFWKLWRQAIFMQKGRRTQVYAKRIAYLLEKVSFNKKPDVQSHVLVLLFVMRQYLEIFIAFASLGHIWVYFTNFSFIKNISYKEYIFLSYIHTVNSERRKTRRSIPRSCFFVCNETVKLFIAFASLWHICVYLRICACYLEFVLYRISFVSCYFLFYFYKLNKILGFIFY